MGQTALPIKRTNFSHHYLRVLTQKTKSSKHFHVRSLVGEGGFEPPKSVTTDLQSAPFGHSGIPPYSVLPSSSFTNPRRKPAKRLRSEKEKGASGYGAFRACGKRNGANAFRRGAGRRTRTPDLLITNQLLYQLSYTSISSEQRYYSEAWVECQALFRPFSPKISRRKMPFLLVSDAV